MKSHVCVRDRILDFFPTSTINIKEGSPTLFGLCIEDSIETNS